MVFLLQLVRLTLLYLYLVIQFLFGHDGYGFGALLFYHTYLHHMRLSDRAGIKRRSKSASRLIYCQTGADTSHRLYDTNHDCLLERNKLYA